MKNEIVLEWWAGCWYRARTPSNGGMVIESLVKGRKDEDASYWADVTDERPCDGGGNMVYDYVLEGLVKAILDGEVYHTANPT